MVTEKHTHFSILMRNCDLPCATTAAICSMYSTSDNFVCFFLLLLFVVNKPNSFEFVQMILSFSVRYFCTTEQHRMSERELLPHDAVQHQFEFLMHCSWSCSRANQQKRRKQQWKAATRTMECFLFEKKWAKRNAVSRAKKTWFFSLCCRAERQWKGMLPFIRVGWLYS